MHVLLRRLPLGAWDWVLIVRAICLVWCGVVCGVRKPGSGSFETAWLDLTLPSPHFPDGSVRT